MVEDDKIKYSDIIQPDDSIEKLIQQMTELNRSYETMVNAIRAGADRVVHALKTVSGATTEGRKSIDEAASSASRLERAYNELKFASSDTGKMLALLKDEIRQTNRTTVEQQKYLSQAVTSYDKLKTELNQMIALYKSLTAAERADANLGQQLINDIINQKNQIKALDDQLKPHIQTLTEVEKAEQRLSYLQSVEGQRLLDIKAKINEVTNARRQQKAVVDPLTQAQQKLAYAQSDENRQLKLYTTQIQEANRVAQLQAQIANSAEGSYNRLSAQYALNKIRLNQMSQAQRETTTTGQQLVSETANIYQQMIKLQEATGNYRLSVGNYARAWNGLGMSVSQVVRELPAATVSLNTFFLGISNNIPMLVDEINKLRAQNKLLAAEGKATVNVMGSITKALFSWNTALVVVLTVLSAYGKEIIDWVKNLGRAKDAVISTEEALKNINKELEENANGYGKNVVQVKRLKEEWSKLKTEAEKTQWIKDNATEFSNLDISINNVTDAENVFVDNTQAVLDALKFRARAAAAQTLAEKKYEEALVKRNEAELEMQKEPSYWDKVQERYRRTALTGDPTGAMPEGLPEVTAEDFQKHRIANLEAEAAAAEADADAYFKLSAAYKDQARAGLQVAGIGEYHKTSKSGTRTPRQRDATEYINRMSLSTQKKYEESITELERDEFAKRRKEAIDTANANTRTLQATYEKNERILKDEENLYKELTDKQVEQIEQAQKQITETIENYQLQLNYELEQIEKDRQINELQMLDETIQLRLQAIKAGSDEELGLLISSIEAQRKIALLENEKLPANQRQSSDLINAAYDKQITTIVTEFDLSSFDQMQELQMSQLQLQTRNSRLIERQALQAERDRWKKQVALAEAGMLDWSDAQIQTAKNTIQLLDREIKNMNFLSDVGDLGLGGAILRNLGFDDRAIDAAQSATDTIIGYIQDIADAEVEATEKAVEAAEERANAAKEAYDAEIEARNNGYANAVDTARMELDLERQNQAAKEAELLRAQRNQETINTITQASSLATASALLWSSFASVPIVGPALAVAAIATMWASFIAAKVKAKQVASQQYGEGGIEFLEGGSHTSGHDIPLGTTNSEGKQMRAEGGEALAIINKRNTAKYRKVLPDVIDSLNKGIFEDKYLNAFGATSAVYTAIIEAGYNPTDTTKLESLLTAIKAQGEIKQYVLPNGYIVSQRGNTKRIIKKN